MVTIVITPKGWTTTVQLGDKKYEEEFKKTRTGAKCVRGNFRKEKAISVALEDELSGFTQHNIMAALNNLG